MIRRNTYSFRAGGRYGTEACAQKAAAKVEETYRHLKNVVEVTALPIQEAEHVWKVAVKYVEEYTTEDLVSNITWSASGSPPVVCPN